VGGLSLPHWLADHEEFGSNSVSADGEALSRL
jgi:hypothetical protein